MIKDQIDECLNTIRRAKQVLDSIDDEKNSEYLKRKSEYLRNNQGCYANAYH